MEVLKYFVAVLFASTIYAVLPTIALVTGKLWILIPTGVCLSVGAIIAVFYVVADNTKAGRNTALLIKKCWAKTLCTIRSIVH